MNSSKSQNDNKEDVKSDIISGAMNAAIKLGDKIPEFLKDATESFIIRNELIPKALAQRQFNLVQTINYANKVNDAHAYYSALYKLFCRDFYKDTVKLVDKGEYSWLINKSMEYSNTSKFIEAAGKRVMKYLPLFLVGYNIKEAFKRASDGDYFGSSLKVVEAGVSLIPGLSFTASILPSSISLIYDFLK